MNANKSNCESAESDTSDWEGRARHSVRAATIFCGLFIMRRRARSDAPYRRHVLARHLVVVRDREVSL